MDSFRSVDIFTTNFFENPPRTHQEKMPLMDGGGGGGGAVQVFAAHYCCGAAHLCIFIFLEPHRIPGEGH